MESLRENVGAGAGQFLWALTHQPGHWLPRQAGLGGRGRDWVIIHDTSLSMNQQAEPQPKGQGQTASVLGRHPRTHSLPHTFPSPKQHWYSVSHPHSLWPSIHSLSFCFSGFLLFFLVLGKGWCVGIFSPSPEKLPTQTLPNPLLPEEMGNAFFSCQQFKYPG